MNQRFIVQCGFGVDQHGHDDDCTNAAIKAIKNAISNNCLTGLFDVCNFKETKDIDRMVVHVKIGAPFPDKINKTKVLKAVPFGEKSIEVVQGGLVTKGFMIPDLGDTSDNIIMCNAAVELSIKPK